jgi:energy-coupling factor transporter ATP-binding protein EcfA2
LPDVRVILDDDPKDCTTLLKEAEIGRVNVVLGANGSGKSTLLRCISVKTRNGAPLDTIAVQGGRAVQFRFLPKRDPEPWTRKRLRSTEAFDRRLIGTLDLLWEEEQKTEVAHKDALYEWDLSGGVSESKPIRPITGLDEVKAAFSSIFPDITVRVEGRERWWCRRDGHDYPISSLSDGEKQVLGMLADLGILAPEDALIIVDEPELNLHPDLAVSLWNWIERRRPSAIFIYATHSLSFAMRPSVTDVFVLRELGTEPLHLITPFDWPSEDLRPFLGAIPAVLPSRELLVVEGEGDASFDRGFYSWILGDSMKVANVGSCDTVKAAVRRLGVWASVAEIGRVLIGGVVDRDYKADWELATFEKAGCTVLPYHEAESYICHPEVAAHAAALRNVNTSKGEVIELLADLCQGHLVRTALLRTIARSQIRLRIGRAKGEAWPETYDDALNVLKKWADDERRSQKPDALPATAQYYFQEEYNRGEQSIKERDIDLMLTLFPGKELATRLSETLGFKNHMDMLNALISAKREAAANAPLANLAKELKKRMNSVAW